MGSYCSLIKLQMNFSKTYFLVIYLEEMLLSLISCNRLLLVPGTVGVEFRGRPDHNQIDTVFVFQKWVSNSHLISVWISVILDRLMWLLS